MVVRKGNPDFVKNPLSGNYIKKQSKTHQLVKKIMKENQGDLMKAKNQYMRDVYTPNRHSTITQKKDFCGERCGYKPHSFPVTTEKQCRSALSYARYATDPNCIRNCALNKAKKHGWRCGVTTHYAL